jgi:hypothetical protein
VVVGNRKPFFNIEDGDETIIYAESYERATLVDLEILYGHAFGKLGGH